MISIASVLAGTTIATTATATAIKTIAMTALQKTLIATGSIKGGGLPQDDGKKNLAEVISEVGKPKVEAKS